LKLYSARTPVPPTDPARFETTRWRYDGGEIAERFSCKWPTTTRHLRTLKNAGLISVRKEGRERLYELNRNRLVDTVTGWLKWFGS